MKTMVRCAGSSLAGVTIEFGFLSLLVSLLHVFYLGAAVIAGVAGFAISFVINRRWAFDGGVRGCIKKQLARHGVVVGGGLALATFLMWLLVGALHLPYQAGWLLGGGFVFFGWTWPMHRFFTFALA